MKLAILTLHLEWHVLVRRFRHFGHGFSLLFLARKGVLRNYFSLLDGNVVVPHINRGSF